MIVTSSPEAIFERVESHASLKYSVSFFNAIIAFDEFGTGFYAKGSYPGKLPTQRITFTSAKRKRSTNGCEYYYDNPQTKGTHGGIKGWMTPNGVFHIGQTANATMYNACKKIIARVKSEVL